MENIVKKAKNYAIECHSSTNHRYDMLDYSVHLEDVFYVGIKFINIIPQNKQQDVLASLWCHDVIEDCRETYNDVKGATNERVAELVYAVTNEKGKNRSERANDKYYNGIIDCPFAVFVKLCDRIANVEYSKKSGSNGMFEKYKKENQNFLIKLNLLSNQSPQCLYSTIYTDMASYLCGLFKNN